MAEFVITLETGEELTYNTDPSSLRHADGSPVDLSRLKMKYVDYPAELHDTDQFAFGKDAPVIGKDSPRKLKVQLGLGCNYSCSYCSQGGQVEEKTSSQDAEAFSFDWVTGCPFEIEFWGGEPLLYWKKLQILVEKAHKAFGKIKMSIVTNGTLLTRERIDWLHDNGFTFAISHDGPGQSLRGEDPLEDPETLEIWRYAFEKMGERAAINCVLTAKNHDLLQIFLWFEARLGDVKLNVEDVVTDYGGGSMSESELDALYKSVRKYAETGMALFFPRIRWSFLHFLQTLSTSKPLVGSHQICGMDRKDQIAVDLHGNVLTCQNAGVESGHKIGHISAMDEVALSTSSSFMRRPNCMNCAVVHLCYGSCMFLDGREFESSCQSSYIYNQAILAGIIKLLTGVEVKSISGWKPKARRVITIKEVAPC
jgi:uncharacterized protein